MNEVKITSKQVYRLHTKGLWTLGALHNALNAALQEGVDHNAYVSAASGIPYRGDITLETVEK